jgi:hypothetical protein
VLSTFSIAWRTAKAPTTRLAAAEALEDLARVNPALVPEDLSRMLEHDHDPSVEAADRAAHSAVANVTNEDRRAQYGEFGI